MVQDQKDDIEYIHEAVNKVEFDYKIKGEIYWVEKILPKLALGKELKEIPVCKLFKCPFGNVMICR
ncbi:MAG: hypothetical protein ACFFCW_10090 [Candidatus Hodarchaeota archaeon]